MGLDTTHDCWHGPYSAFMRWRQALARAAGIPLMLMEGFYEGPEDKAAVAEALKWAAPADGGPACRSPWGPVLYHHVERLGEWLPVKWEFLRPDSLHILLYHSDCDGDIPAEHCAPIAARLEELAPLMSDGVFGGDRARTLQFAAGLRRAAAAGEAVEFH